ncbi:MAG: Gfo/Idh/MocA family oxidoreductase [Planctomycetota bacterium]
MNKETVEPSQAGRSVSRRRFVQASAGVAAAPLILGSGSAHAAGKTDLTVAAIGIGGSRGRYNRGRAIANGAAKFGQMIAVCDVDDLHAQEFNAAYDGKLNTYQDYRKLFENEKPDVVTIGTPDHWHVPIAIHALEHGAHVYCEKPLTLTIEEGELIRKAAAKSNKTFQVGTQQRSTYFFRVAAAIVKSGRLGSNVNANCGIDGAPKGGPFDNSAVPEGLDWDLWLGPAPKRDYCEERRRFFRWYLEYSGGKMTDWGAHHVDIAQWALGLNTAPSTVFGEGEMTPIIPDNFNWKQFLDGEADLPNAYNAATKFNINLDFDSGNRVTVNNYYESGSTKFGNGILFEGEKGRIFVNRGKLQGAVVNEMFGGELVTGKQKDNVAERRAAADPGVIAELDEAFVELCNGQRVTGHMENFFDCIESGATPTSDVESHVNAMNSLHMCNITLMLGRKISWDSESQSFGSDDQANALMSRKRREGFELKS